MDDRFEAWFLATGADNGTVNSRASNLKRIEAAYGSLDDHFAADSLTDLIMEFTYSTQDARESRPNPTRLPISGDFYNNLSMYRSALNRYRLFKSEDRGDVLPLLQDPATSRATTELETERTFSLEKDLQAALRAHISQLEPGLVVIDGGAERSVASGRIDILGRDATGTTVVIELKAVKAPRDAVAQILAYMGDIMAETAAPVRGILVAPDFDAKAIAAASMVPSLALHTYAFTFSFTRLP